MIRVTIVGFTFIALLVGCKEKAPPVTPTEEEVITTVTITLTEVGTSAVTEFMWEDIDGDGSNPPNRIDTFRIKKGAEYTGAIRIENRAITPAEDYTEEIRRLGTQHQFFFATADELVTILPTDLDANGHVVGLAFSVLGKQYGTSVVQVELSHFDDPGSKNGTRPSDETDISVKFPLVVQ